MSGKYYHVKRAEKRRKKAEKEAKKAKKDLLYRVLKELNK